MTTDIGPQRGGSSGVVSLIESLCPIQKTFKSRQSTYSRLRSQPRDAAPRSAAVRLWAGSVTPAPFCGRQQAPGSGAVGERGPFGVARERTKADDSHDSIRIRHEPIDYLVGTTEQLP